MLSPIGLKSSSENESDVFRVCVISHDMPLSNQDSDKSSGLRGLYIDLAEAMAKEMGKSLEVHFTMVAFYKRPVRAGLLRNHCDAHFGLPHEGKEWYIPRRVALSKPFMSIGYAVVVPRSETVRKLEDLRGKTVGVQPGSPPQIVLSQIDGVKMRTFLDPGPALKALDQGQIDAAFVWGPAAGYENKYIYKNKYRVIPAEPRWPVAIGIRAKDTALKEKLNKLIDQLNNHIRKLIRQYGIPSGEAISVQWLPSEGSLRPKNERGGSQHIEGSRSGSQKTSLPPQTIPTDVVKGRSLFNATFGCARCHGPGAKAAERKMDLRLLRKRYGDRAEEVFVKAVLEGRSKTEMPEWKEIMEMNENWLRQVQAFVFSVQKE